ncbi:hypothetical protein AJ80_03589 [Polytolypa hystricis UAMH7299]|uniref:Uncharacterized protein n=1 Tax=Polytolypa hystricis (strain UAMH7299) TaxID=1447883 RepID=A0A2B7YHE6_POLH7|nr:hypothetical protein AJ80_03589 [Polytolypa hystricis UAMH7299]
MSSRLQKAKESMESVYGPGLSTIPDASGWDPPQKSGGHRGRYLWTDAFGVLNFLTLHKESASPAEGGSNKGSDGRYLVFARTLVEKVHDVLGRTRDGESRLPGATDEEPLKGGLRIGKEEATGPDGDGQYHHYLTMWMFALNRMSMATGDPSYNKQGVSLAKAIHPHFFLDRSSPKPHMVWKVAMDLSHPLVVSEGNLDPIDGFVVFRLLQEYAQKHGDGPVLQEEIDDYQKVMDRKGRHKVSRDALDLGMTLWTAHWFFGKESWATDLSNRCVTQLRAFFEANHMLEMEQRYRLAFREFGTCLGIACLSSVEDNRDVTIFLDTWSREIITQWEGFQSSTTPEDLKPITRVMYATALVPGGE